VENQYRFRFIWLPTVQTNHSFIRGSPPSNPPIDEPETESYQVAENRVHYGKIGLEGDNYYFLVTAHDGVYDSVYVNREFPDGWDFSGSSPDEPYSIGDRMPENSFILENIQNREKDEGAMIILRQEIKEFGSNPDPDADVVTLDRFAVLGNEPLRMEVATW
jgi:hypothetical protein